MYWYLEKLLKTELDIELAIKFNSPFGLKKILKNKAPITISTPEESMDLEDYYGI